MREKIALLVPSCTANKCAFPHLLLNSDSKFLSLFAQLIFQIIIQLENLHCKVFFSHPLQIAAFFFSFFSLKTFIVELCPPQTPKNFFSFFSEPLSFSHWLAVNANRWHPCFQLNKSNNRRAWRMLYVLPNLVHTGQIIFVKTWKTSVYSMVVYSRDVHSLPTSCQIDLDQAGLEPATRRSWVWRVNRYTIGPSFLFTSLGLLPYSRILLYSRQVL